MSEEQLDLDQLEADLEAACVDKVDLFDFYNGNWNRLVSEIHDLRARPALSADEVEALEWCVDVAQEGDERQTCDCDKCTSRRNTFALARSAIGKLTVGVP
jgi:hypothetical protein